MDNMYLICYPTNPTIYLQYPAFLFPYSGNSDIVKMHF